MIAAVLVTTSLSKLRAVRSYARLCIKVGDATLDFQDYKIVIYRQEDGAWVAEIPAISRCYALMPTREEALAELARVFGMIADEYREKGLPLPADTTEIAHA